MLVLNLTLKKEAFNVMVTGEKKQEYREPSDWIMNRLIDNEGNDKQYDAVKFTNGYGKDKPYFVCKFQGYNVCIDDDTRDYSNGLQVKLEPGLIIIYLGEVTEVGNIKEK